MHTFITVLLVIVAVYFMGFISALVHELGHYLAMKKHKVEVKIVNLSSNPSLPIYTKEPFNITFFYFKPFVLGEVKNVSSDVYVDISYRGIKYNYNLAAFSFIVSILLFNIHTFLYSWPLFNLTLASCIVFFFFLGFLNILLAESNFNPRINNGIGNDGYEYRRVYDDQEKEFKVYTHLDTTEKKKSVLNKIEGIFLKEQQKEIEEFVNSI